MSRPVIAGTAANVRRMPARKIARMGRLAFDHALQLHGDSIHLWDLRSYGSALALSVLAAEEIGKYLQLDELVYRAVITGSSK